MKRKVRAALVGVVVLFSVAVLAGCGNAGATSTGSSINVIEVETPGGVVTCVAVGGSSVDCDWENTR